MAESSSGFNPDERLSPSHAASRQPRRSVSSILTRNRTSRQYGATKISGRSNAHLGDTYNIHNHYSDRELVPRDSASKQVALNQSLSVEVSQTESLADAISDYDPLPKQRSLFDRRIPGTCDWIGATRQFRAWCDGSGNPMLVCSGSVGCGKSVTASVVFEALTTSRSQSGPVVAAYFFDADLNQITTLDSLIRGILRQLLLAYTSRQLELSRELENQVRRTFVRNKLVTTSVHVSDIFSELCHGLGECEIIIDGLEYLKELEVTSLLRFVRTQFKDEFHRSSWPKWLIFCRETIGRGIPLDKISLATCIHISLDHIEFDLQRYIEVEVEEKRNSSNRSISDHMVSRIKDVLRQNCEKM